MSRHSVALLFSAWLLGGWLLPAGACAAKARTTVSGVFTGCATSQGLTECRVIGRDGKDYFLSANLGCGGVRGNTPEALIEAIDEDTWKGKTVTFEATIAPDGSLKNVANLRLAAVQSPDNASVMRVGVTATGVIDQTDDGFTFQTEDGLYDLVPGKGYRFGDLAELMARHDGAPVRLRGDILRDRDRVQFVLTGTEK